MTAITKDFRLNADKRKSLVKIYEDYIRNSDNKMRRAYLKAVVTFDNLYPKTWELIEKIVRQKQPQDDVDTIECMRAKYGDNGGQIHQDNCFYFTNPSEETYEDYEGRTKTRTRDNEIHLDMTLKGDENFAYAYYYDDLKSKGLEADFKYKWKNEKRNPRYYEAESEVREYLGFRRSKNDDSTDKPINDPKWQKTIPVIGTSYCHSRQFQVDDITHSVLNQFVIAKEKVAQTHEQMFEYIYAKVSKIEQGLKTYTKYSQAKELFDKLGIPLNESQIDEQSSMALSVFSPENLADMLTDKDEEFASREEKIAHFKALANATVN
jgi:hypothetical protein